MQTNKKTNKKMKIMNKTDLLNVPTFRGLFIFLLKLHQNEDVCYLKMKKYFYIEIEKYVYTDN